MSGQSEGLLAMGAAAKAAAKVLAQADTARKNAALIAMAGEIRAASAEIAAANGADVTAARAKGLTPAFLDRLSLGEKRIAAMAASLEEIAALTDPVSAVMARWTRPNGMEISRIRVPIGVIGII